MDYLEMQRQHRIRRIWYAYAYGMAAASLYFLAVIWQMAAAMHAVLLQAGEINATGSFVVPYGVLHSSNALQPSKTTWCNPVNPVGMQFSDFVTAAWPQNWGKPLQTLFTAEYCNQPVPSWVYQWNTAGNAGFSANGLFHRG